MLHAVMFSGGAAIECVWLAEKRHHSNKLTSFHN